MFYGWIIVFICAIAKVAKCQGQNNVMCYTIPWLLRDLRLSVSRLSVLFSCGTVTASLAQPAIGRFADQTGARGGVALSQVALALTLLALSATQPLQEPAMAAEVIAAFAALRALSLGALETLPNACVQKWFVRRRGRAMSLMHAFQQAGVGFSGHVISGNVVAKGWRRTAVYGAVVNVALIVPSVLLLRSTPEAAGMHADGALPEPQPKGEEEQEPESGGRAPLWPLYAFAFFNSLLMGGADFHMEAIMLEVSSSEVSVADHIFFPMAHGVLLTLAVSPRVAVGYGALRGVAAGLHNALLGGLAFIAFGVSRDEIGRALGIVQRYSIAGTGVGPVIFGLSKDFLDSYSLLLCLMAAPPALLAIAPLRMACRPAEYARLPRTSGSGNKMLQLAVEELPSTVEEKASPPVDGDAAGAAQVGRAIP